MNEAEIILAGQEETDLVNDPMIDVQVATANKFPRNVKLFAPELQNLVCTDPEVAKSCVYALPRGGGFITGPSVRFLEAVAACWGNLREEKKSLPPGETTVRGQATVWDVQRNRVVRAEISRRITDKYGKRYNEDMITMTGNAAASIAHRNALKACIPQAIWWPVYKEAEETAAGGHARLEQTRKDCLAYWESKGVSKKRVLAAFSVKTAGELGVGDLATMRGLANAFQEGDLSLDEAFPEPGSTPFDGPPVGKRGFSMNRDKQKGNGKKPPAQSARANAPAQPAEKPPVSTKQKPLEQERGPETVPVGPEKMEVKIPDGVTVADLEKHGLPIYTFELGVAEKGKLVRSAKSREALRILMVGEERKTVIEKANRRISEIARDEQYDSRQPAPQAAPEPQPNREPVVFHRGDEAFAPEPLPSSHLDPKDPPPAEDQGRAAQFALEQQQGPPPPVPTPSSEVNNQMGLLPTIARVRAATTLQELLEVEKGETRKEILDAIRKRLAEIQTPPPEGPPPPTDDSNRPWERHRQGYNPRQ